MSVLPLGTPRAASPRKWGIRMDGVGWALEHQILKPHAANHATNGRPYTLVEIGSAGCVSLRAFADILRETGRAQWRAIGFDLTPDKAWSLNLDEVKQSFAGLPWQVYEGDDWFSSPADATGMMLALLGDPRGHLRDTFNLPIDFCFIDGCHGKCAARDFLAIEAKVAPGGVVVFHDYGELEQGTDFQEHCREFIAVRSYVHRLGLNHPAPKGILRKGWRWVGEIPGSRRNGGDGNSAAVVQRTNEPLETQPELSLD